MQEAPPALVAATASVAEPLASTPSPVPHSDEPPRRLTGSVGEIWSAAMEAATGSRRLRLLMEECAPVSMEGSVLRLRATPGMLSAARAQGKEIEALLTRVRGVPTTLEFIEAPVAHAADTEPGTPATVAADHPLVKRTIELFNAKLVGVQARKAKE